MTEQGADDKAWGRWQNKGTMTDIAGGWWPSRDGDDRSWRGLVSMSTDGKGGISDNWHLVELVNGADTDSSLSRRWQSRNQDSGAARVNAMLIVLVLPNYSAAATPGRQLPWLRVHAPLNEHPVKPGCMWCGRRRLLNPDSKGRKARLISEFYEPIKKEKRKKEKKPFQLSLSHKLSVSPHSILCSNVSKRQVKLSVSSLLYPAHESLVILSDYLLISNEFTARNTTTQ